MAYKIDYKKIIETLRYRHREITISEAGNRIGKYQMLLDICAATDMFRIELENVKNSLNLDIDRDFDFEEYTKNLLASIPQNVNIIPEAYRNNNIMRDPISVLSHYFITPSAEELTKEQKKNPVSFQQLQEKKDKIEKLRRDIIEVSKSNVITDNDVDSAISKAWSELQQVLCDIAKELGSIVGINEKRNKLYEEICKTYFPEPTKASFKAMADFSKWKNGCYDEITEDVLKEHVARELVKVLVSGFTVYDKEHAFSCSRYRDEITALQEYCVEIHQLQEQYAFIRQLIDYKDGLFEIKNGVSLVKYLYDNRKGITPELRDTFFNFIGLCNIVKEARVTCKKIDKPSNAEGIDDHLIRFIFDNDDRRKVVKGLQECKNTGQVAAFTKVLWEEETMKYDVLRSTDFHRAIIPILTFSTTEEAIKQAIFKQVKN